MILTTSTANEFGGIQKEPGGVEIAWWKPEVTRRTSDIITLSCVRFDRAPRYALNVTTAAIARPHRGRLLRHINDNCGGVLAESACFAPSSSCYWATGTKTTQDCFAKLSYIACLIPVTVLSTAANATDTCVNQSYHRPAVLR